jgi:hypothetical protein
VRDGGFYFNGGRVWLMGVERMAGSNPEYGMAEPAAWILHDHNDLKELNCVFSRVHWQQDERVLEYCDRHGILLQEEVPTWGSQTFSGVGDQPSPEIMENGLEQLREMIQRDRMEGYALRWIVYVRGDLPMEQHETPLPRLAPGQSATVALSFRQEGPTHIRVEIIRPTGFLVMTTIWKA